MERKQKKLYIMFVLTWILAINLLWTSNTAAQAVNTTRIKSITVKIGNKNVTKKTYTLNKWDSAKLKITVIPKGAKKSVVFKSSRSDIVNINSKGKLHIKRAGTAKITITVKAKNGKEKKTWVKLKVRKDSSDTYDSVDTSSAKQENKEVSNTTVNNIAANNSNHAVNDNIENTSGAVGNISNSTGKDEAEISIPDDNNGNLPDSSQQQESNTAGNIQTYSNFDDFAKAVSELVKNHKADSSSSLASVDEFYSGRLIVKGDGAAGLDFSAYSPDTVLKSDDNMYIVQFATSDAAKKAMSSIGNLPHVVWVEADFCASVSEEASDSFTAKAAASSLSWGVSRLAADRYAEFIREKGTQQSILVGVIDTGVSSHPFLEGRIADTGYDFGDGDYDPSDTEGHGTHVAGTIVDCTPGLTVKILPVRVMDSRGEIWSITVSNGIKYAVNHGAKVINLSLACKEGISQCMDEAVEYAVARGVTVVAAAGNKNEDAGKYSPSHLDNVIVVGAVDSDEHKANFSNFGWTVDVVAPGEDIQSTVPGNAYQVKRGTSMASPHVAAIAAMFLLDDPSLTPAQVEQKIKSNTRDLGDAGRDQYYGYGIPDLTGLTLVFAHSISLDQTSAKTGIGGTVSLTATVLPENAVDKKVTWSSNNLNVATVDNGVVTAVGEGTAVITAKTGNGWTASCQIEVYDPSDFDPEEERKLVLDRTDAAILVGESIWLTASVQPNQGADNKVTWSSSAPEIVAVDNGTITGLKKGTGVITAMTESGLTAFCTVEVTEPSDWDPVD